MNQNKGPAKSTESETKVGQWQYRSANRRLGCARSTDQADRAAPRRAVPSLCANPAQPVERLLYRRRIPHRGWIIPRRRARSRLRSRRDEAPNQSRRPAAARLCPDFRGQHPAPSSRPTRLHPSHRQKTRLGHAKPSEHRRRLSKSWISTTADPPAAYPSLG